VRPVTDDYFGTKAVDPYRYMENLKDREVQAWMKAQNDYTRAVLARIPSRQQLLARIRQFDQSAPAQVSDVRRLPGDVYFYQKLLAGENVGKLYMRAGLDGKERLLVDPGKTTLRAQVKGEKVIAYFAPSDDAKYVAVGIMPGGSEDDSEIHVIETASGRETGDVILRARDIVSPATEGGIHAGMPGTSDKVP
jgi:prolyl oligopeptidase